MRILITTDTIGGVWTFTQDLSQGLLEAGCSVALVSLGRPPSLFQQQWCDLLTCKYAGSFQYEALDMPLEWMQNNDQAYLAAEPALLHMAESFGAELFHSNQFCFGALRLNIPRVITAHSDVLSWAHCCRGGGLADTPWLKRYRALVEDGLRAADAVVAPTRWMLDALAEHFLLPMKQVVVPNGSSVAPAGPVARSLQAITAGRVWDEGKDLALLRDVSPLMPLLIAGEIQHDGAASSPPSWGEAQLLGPLSRQQVLDLFRRSAIYICPSIYEPFGLAPLEAALCGCAVLARDIPSLREVWADSATYFDDAPSLSELLQQLHDDPALLARKQQESVARAKFFTAERMTLSYLALYGQRRAEQRAAAHAA